ncbi:MAG: PD-(D/E)XK nuclease family protein [Actinomycetota bacterium]
MPLDPPLVFPAVEPGEPVTLSASAFVTFQRCPEQALGRMRGVYPAESRPAFSGNLAHRIFARHLRAGPIPAEGFSTACREEIGTALNPKLSALRLRPRELEGVIQEVAVFYQRFCRLGLDGFAGAEVALESVPAEGVMLRGKVDAVFDEGEAGTRLTDWKTGSLGDPGPQLGFYALLWALERGDLPGRVEAVSLASGERVEEVPTRTGVQGTAAAAAQVVSLLRRAFTTGGHLERAAGPWCRWCPLLDECEEGRAATTLLDG